MSELPKESKFEHAEKVIHNLTGYAIKLAIIILFAVVAWRIAWSNFSLDLSKFDFSDLLAMILAIFAIAMSVAFYFKSTDSSNQFYDNIYNFTQKTSEILGRIEERFGERLKHLDEGYGKIQSKFDGISSSGEIKKKVKETEGKEEKEKKKLEETNEEMQKMLESLTEKAKLEQKEKEEFYKKMTQLSEEKNKAQERIRRMEKDRDQLQSQLIMMEKHMMGEIKELHNYPYLEELFHHHQLRELIMLDAPQKTLKKHFKDIVIKNFPESFVLQLQEDGIINRNLELTPAGSMILKTIFRRYKY